MNKTYTSKGTPKKMETVKGLSDKVGKATSIIVTEYQGIKHKQFEELRRNLRKTDAEFVIAKNRLLKRALGDKGPSIEPFLEQPTASLISYADAVAPLQVLLKFFKAAGFGKVKGGLLGDRALTNDEVTRLASLPPRIVLLGKLVRQLNAPIQGLHYALQWNMNKIVWVLHAIKEKKSS
jgi:large subunit ribosomal protein L10